MRTTSKLTKNLIESLSEAKEPISYTSFRNQILNDVEMYEEDLLNDGDDVFGGTIDSYANEMIEQHLFDTIYYNIKGNYDSQDAAMNTAQDVMFYLLDFVKKGEVSLQKDSQIKEIYDKYVLNKTDDQMNEDTSMDDSLKAVKKEMVHKSRLKATLNALHTAKNFFSDENEYYTQADSSVRFNYENLLSDIEELISKASEFINEQVGEKDE